MNARGPIHAMLPILDSPQEAEAREAELDRRLNTYRAEVLAETTASEAEVRTDALKTFLYLLEQSAGPAVAEKLLEDAPELPRLIAAGSQPAAGVTVYRASQDSIVMGFYTTAAEARRHCETALRREHDESTKVALWWCYGEEDTDESGEAVLFSYVTPRGFRRGNTWRTGYTVTPQEVVARFDEKNATWSTE